ncbi:MAG: hypothetical protein ABUT39_15200 [Acidobacteriota bacterium]
MHKYLSITALVLFVLVAPAVAKTPDGQTPSQETICDSYSGAAYGLCTAYCEAMDCESPEPHASATACSRVGDHFMRLTGADLPCNASCPCTALPLFAAFVDGSSAIAECVSGGGMANVADASGNFVSVTEALTCSQNGQPPTINLTQNEADSCRQLLRDAAAAQNVVCSQPE